MRRPRLSLNFALALQETAFVLMIVAVLTGAIVLHNQAARISAIAHQNTRLAMDGQQAHAGLCALKADLRRRINEGVQFLVDHPHGIAGIPASVISASITSEALTLTALHPLVCETKGSP